MNINPYYKYTQQVFDPSYNGYFIKLIGVALGACMSFLMPISEFLYYILGLVLADLATGWYKSYKITKKTFKEYAELSVIRKFVFLITTIQSRGIGRTLEKLMVYLILMAVSQGFDWKYELEGNFALSWYIGGIIIAREIKSVYENGDAILGSDFFKNVSEFITRMNNNNANKQ